VDNPVKFDFVIVARKHAADASFNILDDTVYSFFSKLDYEKNFNSLSENI
jgi:hypothetical protein